jgi:hypothetical protein
MNALADVLRAGGDGAATPDGESALHRRAPAYPGATSSCCGTSSRWEKEALP